MATKVFDPATLHVAPMYTPLVYSHMRHVHGGESPADVAPAAATPIDLITSRATSLPPLPSPYKSHHPPHCQSHSTQASKVKQSNNHNQQRAILHGQHATSTSYTILQLDQIQWLPLMVSMTSLTFTTAGGISVIRLPASALSPRRRALVVRAQAEDAKPPSTEEPSTTTTSSSSTPTTPPTPKSKLPAAKPGLWDALAFSGPAPERINGRLAMVGFVSALAVEASRGGGLLSQAGSGTGLTWFAATAAVLSVASLVPVLKGESAESRGDGVMNADAELWNGRFAMLGLVALAFTEYLTGAPFINA